MKKNRIVVTGMGLVSCFGCDVDHFYNQLLAGESGVVPITEFPCEEFPTRFAGSVQDFNTDGYIDKKRARRIDPFIRYSIVAGKRALEYSRLTGRSFDALDKKRCGIIIGSGMGGMSVFYEGVANLLTKGFKRITPFFVPYIITNMGGALLSIDLGFQGPNYSIATACATATYSIIAAAEHIIRGDADLMIAGGAESAINPVGLGGFVACRALSERNDMPQQASRPWDKDRDGFVMGEGSGTLVLESLEHAQKRGATILAEYLGGSVSSDAYHMTDPREDGSGVAECIRLTLKNAGIDKEQINYINAHATSTLIGDLCEMRGIKSVFGDHIKNVFINGTKSITGHCLGAAGGVEAIATIKAILTSTLHPTINIDNLEEELNGLNLVRSELKDFTITGALSNSFGFGGHNSSIAFGAFKE